MDNLVKELRNSPFVFETKALYYRSKSPRIELRKKSCNTACKHLLLTAFITSPYIKHTITNNSLTWELQIEDHLYSIDHMEGFLEPFPKPFENKMPLVYEDEREEFGNMWQLNYEVLILWSLSMSKDSKAGHLT